ncbi:MAG: YegP family protein [Bacteroidales bacterium]|nr:YegP family protein [Bacteroidales bacterium]
MDKPSKPSCMNGMASIRKNAPVETIKDKTR